MMNDAISIATDILTLAASGLFDPLWYERRYPESLHGGGNALVHFCYTGWKRGYQPNAYFDTAFYLARNSDVREASINPLVHYLDYGEKEQRWASLHFDPAWYRNDAGLAPDAPSLAHLLARMPEDEPSPNPGFDPAWYRGRYGVLIPPGQSAFADYMTYGAREGRQASLAQQVIGQSRLFDETFYCTTYPSVIESGLDPLYHFCAIGWREGFWPNATFDTGWYGEVNDDVRAAGINPLFHYLRYGAAEGRLTLRPAAKTCGTQTDSAPEEEPDISQALAIIAESGLFDVNFYLANYPDIRENTLDPLEHFCRFGVWEGRRPNAYFDPLWYAQTYMEGEGSINYLAHYIQEGERLGFQPIVYFAPAWYREIYELPGDQSALAHFLTYRRSQRFSPTPHFDLAFYLDGHRAEIGNNRDPFAHFLRTAILQNHDPSANFDCATYRAKWMEDPPDSDKLVPGNEIHKRIARERYNPLVHFLLRGSCVTTTADDASLLLSDVA